MPSCPRRTLAVGTCDGGVVQGAAALGRQPRGSGVFLPLPSGLSALSRAGGQANCRGMAGGAGSQACLLMPGVTMALQTEWGSQAPPRRLQEPLHKQVEAGGVAVTTGV